METITASRVWALLVIAGLCVLTASCGNNQERSSATGSQGSNLVVWANEGEDKVTRDELRMSNGAEVRSRAWDGTTIRLFAARNEVVSFNLVLEAAGNAAQSVGVTLDRLDDGAGHAITGRQIASSDSALADKVFDYTQRDIELFYVRYLQIKGLSSGFHVRDQLQVPKRFRLPYTTEAGCGQAVTGTGWADRPDHDKFYPDIAVPMDAVQSFDIAAHQNQSIWVDIFVPPGTPAGTYRGTVTVSERGSQTHTVPVELVVHAFDLPDSLTAKTMLFIDSGPVTVGRYKSSVPSQTVLERHVQMAHRHRISVVGADSVDVFAEYQPSAGTQQWITPGAPLFTTASGYRGPGMATPNDVFAVSLYGAWFNTWASDIDAPTLQSHADGWVNWFNSNAPGVEYFLYLKDEPETSVFPDLENWASWIHTGSGPGKALRTFVTSPLIAGRRRSDGSNGTEAYNLPQTNFPDVDIVCSILSYGDPATYNAALSTWVVPNGKSLWFYNGGHPGMGAVVIEEDGIAFRQIPWAEYKLGLGRYFYWASTTYGTVNAPIDVFNVATTWGGNGMANDSSYGLSTASSENGAGLLFYPGTDEIFPQNSYDLNGPIASLRLKHWRRGVQDVEYLALAASKDKAATDAIVSRVVPRVLWEVGVPDPNDPSYPNCGEVSWSSDPDIWEQARAELANIIDQ